MARKPKPSFTRRDFIRWSAGGVLTSLAPFAYALRSADWLSVEHMELRVPNWDADGFRIVVIADLHMASQRQYENAMAAQRLAKKQKADAILIPGDFVDQSGPTPRKYIKDFCERITRAKVPVLATLGNHDYGTAAPELVIREIQASRVRLLRNEVVDIDGVSIAGIDDAIFHRERPDVLTPGKHSRSLLAMFHEPDFVTEMPDHVSLQVSGHSHGGQICLPFGIPVHTPYGAKKYIDGFYPDAKVPLFVTRGVGTTGVPYRMFCRPQVAVITIRKA